MSSMPSQLHETKEEDQGLKEGVHISALDLEVKGEHLIYNQIRGYF